MIEIYNYVQSQSSVYNTLCKILFRNFFFFPVFLIDQNISHTLLCRIAQVSQMDSVYTEPPHLLYQLMRALTNFYIFHTLMNSLQRCHFTNGFMSLYRLVGSASLTISHSIWSLQANCSTEWARTIIQWICRKS